MASLANLASDIPVIGKWIGRVGKTLDILSAPCSPSPQIWIMAAFNAAPMIFYGFIKPSPTDYLASRVGRGKKGFKFDGNPYLPFRILGAGATDAAIIEGINILRRVGWYFTLADGLTGFGLNWTSLAYKWNGCSVPQGANGQSHIPGGDVISLLPAGSEIVTNWNCDQAVGCFCDPSGFDVPGDQIASASFSISQMPNKFPPLPDAEASYELVNGSVPVAGQVITNGVDSDGNKTTHIVYANGLGFNRAWNKAISGGQYRVRLTKGFGVLQIASGTFTVTASPRNNAITPDP